MLGANKSIGTQRFSNNEYADHLSDVMVRWSAIKATAVNGYITKAKHVAHKMMSDRIDIIAGDRIIWEDSDGNGRIFVVAGVADFEEEMGQHKKTLIREVASHMHTTVERLTPFEDDSGYDPVFEEKLNSAANTVDELKVLLDPIESAKESFIKILGEGKLVGVDWIMTVDFPDAITDKNKFRFSGTTYDVKWIVPEPFQTLVGLAKSIENYAN